MTGHALMSERDIRQLIRALVAEELQSFRPESGAHAETSPVLQVCQEFVTINSDHDLMLFVGHLLELAKDGRIRREIESRQRVFRLERSPGGGFPIVRDMLLHRSDASDVPPAHFDGGLITERHVNAIPEGTQTMHLGKRTRLTPLARDRVRQRGIEIVRSS